MSESEVQIKNSLWQTMIRYFKLEKYDINEDCVRMVLKDRKTIISVFERTEKGFLALEIPLHGAEQIQMILGQVGIAARLKVHPG